VLYQAGAKSKTMASNRKHKSTITGDSLAGCGNGQQGWALGSAPFSRLSYGMKGIIKIQGLGFNSVNLKWGSCEASPG